jgi:hypothetical protein
MVLYNDPADDIAALVKKKLGVGMPETPAAPAPKK